MCGESHILLVQYRVASILLELEFVIARAGRNARSDKFAESADQSIPQKPGSNTVKEIAIRFASQKVSRRRLSLTAATA